MDPVAPDYESTMPLQLMKLAISLLRFMKTLLQVMTIVGLLHFRNEVVDHDDAKDKDPIPGY